MTIERNRKSRLIAAAAVAALAIAGLGWPASAAAQTFQEFPIPTGGSFPSDMALGSDGNLWFTERFGNKIGRIDTAGVITEFTVPLTRTTQPRPVGITAGPDGNLWFTENNSNKIGRITTAGVITEFTIPTANSGPLGITAGSDGALWFTEDDGNNIGQITTDGLTINEYPIPTAGSRPFRVTAGPDGALWFTELAGNRIGRITTDGLTINEYPIPTGGSQPFGITTGPDGALWFTENIGNRIGRITTDGLTIDEYPIPTAGSQPFGITVGADGALWFVERFAALARITTAGVITEYPIPTPTGGPQGTPVTGPDEAVWFAENNGNKIARFGAEPGTISKAFGAPTVSPGGTTPLTFTLTNPNAALALKGVDFTDTLPSGLVVATPNGLAGSCGGGTITATAGSGSISLSGATIAGAGSCSFSVDVLGVSAGTQNNTTSAVTSTNGRTGNTASASVVVIAPPAIGKSFGAASILLGSSTGLTFTLNNANAATSLTGVGFTDSLPSGLVVATPNGLTGSCGGGTLTATAGSGSISLTGATLAGAGSCSFSLDVTGTSAGTKNNTTGAVTSANAGTGNTASASVDVIAPPAISKSFGAPTVGFNGTTSLSFTLTNPNAPTTLTGVGFTDTFPSGLVVATPNGLTGSCGGGTITATAGSGTISLSGATLAASSSCLFSVNVTGTSLGVKNNTTSQVSSTNGGIGNAASASLTVNPGSATQFTVSAPGTATAGTAFSITVTAKDSGDNTATGYTGTVHFTSSDATAILPADTVLTNGIGTFSATLKAVGGWAITATDTVTASITGTTGSIQVGPAAATHFAVTAPSSATVGTGVGFTVTALDSFNNTAATYGGTVHFSSSDVAAVLPANATLANGMGTFTATPMTAASQTITATDTLTASITGTSNTIAVAKANQTITFGALGGKTFGDPPFAVSATGGASGNPVTFTSTTTGVCTVSATTVTIVAAGPCTIAADQAGNGNYTAAPQVTRSFTVAKGSQAITFGVLGSKLLNDPPFPVSATASSTLPVTFTSLTAAVCAVTTSGTVTLVGLGTCTIAADQAGNASYNAAPQVTRSFAVGANCAAVTIAQTSLPLAVSGLPYASSLTLTTSATPVTWTITGALPNGVTFTNGAFGGTPTTRGAFPITVTGTDANACQASASLTLAVSAERRLVAGAGAGGAPTVRTFNLSSGTPLTSFDAYQAAFTGGVSVALGDTNGDGGVDTITGAGPGGSPHVEVFDPGATGARLSFLAFDPSFRGGVDVAAGDLDRDGAADVLVVGGCAAPPVVRAFDGRTGGLVRDYAFTPPDWSCGFHVAAADVTGDGVADPIVSSAGGGAPFVIVLDGVTGAVVRSFNAYPIAFTGGVYVAAGDVNGDGFADIITGAGPGGGPHVRVWDGKTGSELRGFFAYDPAFSGGVRVAAGDLNGDGSAEIITAAGAGGGPHVRVFDGATNTELLGLFAFDGSFGGGVFVGAAAPLGRMVIDFAAPFGAGQVRIAGWALREGTIGAGTDAIHVWAYPVAGGTPVFVAASPSRNARPDVAAYFGGEFLQSGFDFAGPLAPGTYDLVVYARNSVTGLFDQARVIRVTVN